jgi:hypothetical protein
VSEGFQQDLADRRPGPRWAHPGAGCASKLADQMVASVIEPLQHGHLSDQVRDWYSFIAHVVHQPLLETQGLLQGRGKFVSDCGHVHAAHLTGDSMLSKHGELQ